MRLLKLEVNSLPLSNKVNCFVQLEMLEVLKEAHGKSDEGFPGWRVQLCLQLVTSQMSKQVGF